MASAIFGLFSADRSRQPTYSLQKLQALHERLQSTNETDDGEAKVEVIREMTEMLIWGLKNDQNDNFFDFFCEKNILADFVGIVGRQAPRSVKVQLLQSLSMLIQNTSTSNRTNLYYLFSNNHVNQLIATQFDWADEEILTYYISFLKSLAMRLNQDIITFFFNQHTQQFPLYTQAIRFFSHHDNMVCTAVRTLTLRVFSVQDAAMQKFVLRVSRQYFERFMGHLRLLWAQLDDVEARTLEGKNEEQKDLVMYLSEVLQMNIPELSALLAQQFLDYACYPSLLHSLTCGRSPTKNGDLPQAPSWTTSLFLLNQIFGASPPHVEILEPLAQALLSRQLPAATAAKLHSRPLPERTEVWEPFDLEASSADPTAAAPAAAAGAKSESLHAKLMKFLKQPQEALLTCGLLRACLQVSNVLPQELLVEAGLLPPVCGLRAAQPLEVLQVAAEALQLHGSVNMVVVQALCRLCLDVAFTPQARSLCGSREWRETPLLAIAEALRSAAQQVRGFDSLGDEFLDVFAEAWARDPVPDQLKHLCSNLQCLRPNSTASDWAAPAQHSDTQQASKAVRVMLMLRRLHSDLSKPDGPEPSSPPKTAPTARRTPPPPAAYGGGIITSALAPVEAVAEELSPLQVPEEDFPTSDGRFELQRMDRLVCGVNMADGQHTRYLVLHQHLLLLVKPDLEKPGWALVTTLVPVRYVETQVDKTDPLLLRLTLPGGLGQSEASPFGAGFLLSLRFEDSRRCTYAESHLKKCRRQVREQVSASVQAFVERLCQ